MKFSIRISILQTFTLLVLLTVIGITVTFYAGSSRIMADLYTQLAQQAAKRIIDRTISFLEVPGGHTRMMADVFEDIDTIGQHQKIWKYMWKQMMLTPQITSFYVADSRGNFVQTRRTPALATRIIDQTVGSPVDRWVYRDINYKIRNTKRLPVDYDPRLRPWYRNTGKEKKIYWSDVYLFHSTGQPGITGSCPVFDQNGNLKAIVGVDITLRSLAEFVASQRQIKRALLFIVTDKEEVISSWAQPVDKGSTANDRHLPLIHEVDFPWVVDAYRKLQTTGKELVVSTTNDRKYLGILVTFPDAFAKKWKIGSVIPEEEVTGSTRSIIIKAVVIAVLITLVCLLLVFVASGLITRPVKMLADEAGLIKDLRLEEAAGVQSKFTEIRSLNDAFIAMKNGLASFLRYVPADLVRQLVATGKEAKLGGEKARLAIMFTDIVGFTAISESLPAEKLMLQLSEYLDRLTRVIQEELGTVDKYIGDGIMAFWGAPRKLDNPAYRACRAALRCQEGVAGLNEKWKEEGNPAMPTCIGIHAGETIVGNVGSSERMNYSIFGDNVNLASRLEGVNRFYGTGVIISHDVYTEIVGQFVCRPLDIVAVKGKKQSIKIYELVAELADSTPVELVRFHGLFEQGFTAYLNRDWDQALRLFESLGEKSPDDIPVQLYLKRCKDFKNNPEALSENWDGVVTLTNK